MLFSQDKDYSNAPAVMFRWNGANSRRKDEGEQQNGEPVTKTANGKQQKEEPVIVTVNGHSVGKVSNHGEVKFNDPFTWHSASDFNIEEENDGPFLFASSELHGFHIHP